MTFTDIQNEIIDRLNLTSAQAIARVGRAINERYKWLASDLGFITLDRGEATSNTTIGSQDIIFNCKKVLSVFNTAYSPVMVLKEMSFDELRNQTVNSDPPQYYAINLTGANTVTVRLDVIPASVYPLSADAEVSLLTLSGVMTPAFDEDFHGILVYGGMVTELEKMEKYDLADRQEKRFQERLSGLRYSIMKSAYMDWVQGKDSPERLQSSVPLIP